MWRNIDPGTLHALLCCVYSQISCHCIRKPNRLRCVLHRDSYLETSDSVWRNPQNRGKIPKPLASTLAAFASEYHYKPPYLVPESATLGLSGLAAIEIRRRISRGLRQRQPQAVTL